MPADKKLFDEELYAGSRWVPSKDRKKFIKLSNCRYDECNNELETLQSMSKDIEKNCKDKKNHFYVNLIQSWKNHFKMQVQNISIVLLINALN